MRASRFNEEQIIAILREQEAGGKTADVCRKHGVSGATFYKWKSRYGGLDVSDARRLKTLEDENAKLKKLDTSKNLGGRHQRLTSWRTIRNRSGNKPESSQPNKHAEFAAAGFLEVSNCWPKRCWTMPC